MICHIHASSQGQWIPLLLPGQTINDKSNTIPSCLCFFSFHFEPHLFASSHSPSSVHQETANFVSYALEWAGLGYTWKSTHFQIDLRSRRRTEDKNNSLKGWWGHSQSSNDNVVPHPALSYLVIEQQSWYTWGGCLSGEHTWNTTMCYE